MIIKHFIFFKALIAPGHYRGPIFAAAYLLEAREKNSPTPETANLGSRCLSIT